MAHVFPDSWSLLCFDLFPHELGRVLQLPFDKYLLSCVVNVDNFPSTGTDIADQN
jgi:hypothetical protein